MRLAAVVLGLSLIPHPLSLIPAAHAVTEKPRATAWDQLMAEQAVRHLQTGYEAFSKGDYEAATKLFSKAVVSNPEDARTHIMLGVAHYWSGRVTEAMAAYHAALERDPANPQAHQLIGIAHAWQGDMPKALASFNEAIKHGPDRADIHMDLGSVYQSLGRPQEALDSFRKAVALDPKYPLYHYQLGVLYDQLGREDQAVDELKEAVKLWPEYQDALLQLGSLRQRGGKLDDAEKYFRKAVRLKPGDAVARLRLGLVLVEQGEAKKARKDLQRAFQLSPGADGSRLALSQAYRGSAPGPGTTEPKPAGPLDSFRKNLERIPPTQEAQVTTRLSYVKSEPIKLEKPKEGAPADRKEPAGPQATVVSRTFALKPSDAAGRARQIDAALADLQKTLDTTPDGAHANINMDISYPQQAIGWQSEEEQASRQVSYEPRRIGNDLGLWVQGSVWIQVVEETLPVLAKRLESDPQDATSKVLLGLSFLTLGKAAEARTAFEAALSQDQKDVDAWLGLGAANVAAGKDDDAVASYLKVLELEPKNRVAKQSVAWLTETAKKK